MARRKFVNQETVKRDLEKLGIGMQVRALRTGYAWSREYECYIRIRAGGPPWTVDLAPNNFVPRDAREVTYLVLSDNPDILKNMKWVLRNRLPVKEPQTFEFPS